MTTHYNQSLVTVSHAATVLASVTDHETCYTLSRGDRRKWQAFYAPSAHELRPPQPVPMGGMQSDTEGDARWAVMPAAVVTRGNGKRRVAVEARGEQTCP